MKVSSRGTVVLLALTAFAAGACSDATGQPPEPKAAAVPAAPGTDAVPRLAFFMNPNGMPCQMQDRILRDMSPELAGKADLVYFRTTLPSDLPEFDRYGIRSLPALVLTDPTGREIRRATPGIQSADQIRRLLGR